jgi:hypothetical protein
MKSGFWCKLQSWSSVVELDGSELVVSFLELFLLLELLLLVFACLFVLFSEDCLLVPKFVSHHPSCCCLFWEKRAFPQPKKIDCIFLVLSCGCCWEESFLIMRWGVCCSQYPRDREKERETERENERI